MSLKRKSRNSILMRRNYLDLGKASDWLKFFLLFSRTSFLGESRNSVTKGPVYKQTG